MTEILLKELEHHKSSIHWHCVCHCDAKIYKPLLFLAICLLYTIFLEAAGICRQRALDPHGNRLLNISIYMNTHGLMIFDICYNVKALIGCLCGMNCR